MRPDNYSDLICRVAAESENFTELGEIETSDLLDDCLNAIYELRERVERHEAFDRYNTTLLKRKMG